MHPNDVTVGAERVLVASLYGASLLVLVGSPIVALVLWDPHWLVLLPLGWIFAVMAGGAWDGIDRATYFKENPR